MVHIVLGKGKKKVYGKMGREMVAEAPQMLAGGGDLFFGGFVCLVFPLFFFFIFIFFLFQRQGGMPLGFG